MIFNHHNNRGDCLLIKFVSVEMVDSIGLKRVNSPCRRGLFFLSLRPLLFDFTRKGKVDIKECVNVDVTV